MIKTLILLPLRLGSMVTIFLLASLVAFVFYNGNQPMTVPEAKGLTYIQFMDDRWQAIQNLPDECQARWTTIWLTQLPLDLLYGTLFTAKALYPNAPIRIGPTSVTVPKSITWSEAPATFWSVVEQMGVITFVRVQGRECVLPPVQS